MNKFKKLMCLFLSVLMILSMGIPAFAIDKATDSTSTNETQKTAVNAEKNPLEITIATDKAEYKVTNVAKITATVTNTGKEDIKNVSAEAVFNDLAPVSKKTSETKKEVETLKSGESISFTYKATLNPNEHKLNLFQKIFLWFVRLFNGGYTPSDNGFDNGRDCTEQTYNLIFGKFATENVIRVWYGEQLQEISDEDFNTFQDIRKSIENLSKNDEVINILEKEMQRGNVTNYQVFDNYITYETAFGIRGIWEDKTFFNSENKSVSLNNKSNFVNNTPSGNTYTDIINKVTTSSIISSLGDVAVIRPYRSTDFQYDDFLTTGEIIADTIGVEVDTFDNTNATLSVLRNLDDYGIVLIDSHGSLIENEPFICLTQTYSNQQVPSSDLDSLFINQNNEIRVSGNFFQENYDNNFDECFVFLGTCYGMFNNSIADALISNGVDCVYGYTNPVSVAYCNDTLVESMLENLLLDLTTSSIAYNNTVSVCGRTDPYNNGTNFVIQQSNDFCLSKTGYATGTVKDNITNKALSNVVVKAMRDGFVKTAKTNKNGEFKIELPVGKWEISVEDTATHYCHKKLSVTIEENVETVLINHIYMTRKTGEALCAVYDKTTNNAIENVKIEAIDISSKPLISSYDEFKKHEIVATATTDSKGLASLDLLYGSYLLAFTHDNYEYFMKEVEINAELDISAYDVKLTPKGSSGEDDRPVTASGNCGANGDNVKWVLYDDGELVISGQGEMKNYTKDNYYKCTTAPWSHEFDYSKIKKVRIEDGVTSIGRYAFTATRAESVTISDTVNCIESSFEFIYDIYYSGSIEEWCAISFAKSLGACEVLSSGSHTYDLYVNNKLLTDLTFPNNITEINQYTFSNCKSIRRVKFGSGIQKIGKHAFDGCTNIESIELSDSIINIDDYAFSGIYAITGITIPDSVINIGKFAFSHCSNLININFGDNLQTIGNNAFMECASLDDTLIIPDSVETIGTQAFHQYSGTIRTVVLGKNVRTLGSLIFGLGLESIYYNGSLQNWCNINKAGRITDENYDLYINNTLMENIEIPTTVTEIKSDSFHNCKSISSVTIPDSVTSIEYDAFRGCTSLTEITISDSVTSIKDSFCGCTSLEKITINNPNCTIYDSETTISDTATIYGYSGSTAEAYAKKYNRKFVAL